MVHAERDIRKQYDNAEDWTRDLYLWFRFFHRLSIGN